MGIAYVHKMRYFDFKFQKFVLYAVKSLLILYSH